MAEGKAEAEALLPLFQTTRVLNQDQDGRRVSLYGSIKSQPAVLVIERAPFPTSEKLLSSIPISLSRLRNLGSNDVYRWYLGQTGSSPSASDSSSLRSGATSDAEEETQEDLKLNLFWPATDKHVRKYSRQQSRVVVETGAIWKQHVQPFIQRRHLSDPSRLRWIYDILDGRAEADDVLHRSSEFVLLPDLNWDRRTFDALHLLALVCRRDIGSVRDLRKSHIPWLRSLREEVINAAIRCAPKEASLESDQLKLYVHYQPTYYHFHVHVVHVAAEGSGTQAVGKAIGIDAILQMLELLPDASPDGQDEGGMQDVTLTYHVGEESELWKEVWEPLKRGVQPAS